MVTGATPTRAATSIVVARAAAVIAAPPVEPADGTADSGRSHRVSGRSIPPPEDDRAPSCRAVDMTSEVEEAVDASEAEVAHEYEEGLVVTSPALAPTSTGVEEAEKEEVAGAVAEGGRAAGGNSGAGAELAGRGGGGGGKGRVC